MPIITPSWTDAVSAALDGLIGSLRKTLGDLESSTDVHQLLARLQPLFRDLAQLDTDLAPVPAGSAFLAPDGTQPQDGQLTIDQFCEKVAQAADAAWTPDLTAAFGPVMAGVAAAPGGGPGGGPGSAPGGMLAAFLRTVNPMLDPEIYIRYAFNLRESMDPATVASTIASAATDAAAAAVAALDPAWGDDEPMSDEDKKLEEPDVGLKEGTIATKWLDSVLAGVPGADGPQDPRVGRDVHRAIMAGYVLDHPGRLVIVDGSIQLSTPVPLKLQLSRLLSPAGAPLSADPQLIAFSNLMRDPTTGKRVHPDIADMGDRAQAVDDDWGWFEIKPMADVRLAIEEIYFYYLDLWNPNIRAAHPEWEKSPGVWQPTMISVTPRYGYIFAAVTVFPGAIGYLSYSLKNAALAAEAVIITALSGLFLKRLLDALRQLAKDLKQGGAAVAEFVVAWAALVLAAVGAVFAAIALIPEELGAGAAGVISALASRLEPLIADLATSGG